MSNKLFYAIVALLLLVFVGLVATWLVLRGGGRVNLGQLTGAPAATPAAAEPEPTFPTGETQTITANAPLGVEVPEPEEEAFNNPGNLGAALARVYGKPVAGIFSLGTSSSTARVIVVERPTGHIYEITEGQANRVSNTTIPKIYEAQGLGQTASTSYLVYRSLAGSRPTNSLITLSGEAVAKPLSQNIAALAANPQQTKVAYLEAQAGKINLVVANKDFSAPSPLLTLAFSELTLSWPTENTITLLTKPSAKAPGYLYFFDLKTKKLSQILGGITGLAVKMSPNGQKILESGSERGELFTAIYDLKTKSSSRLPLKTFAEKCAWSADSLKIYCAAPRELPAGDYPDAWYRGEVSSSDVIWEFNLANQEAKMLSNPELANSTLDASVLYLDPKEENLYLINKRDLSLWRLRLEPGF